MMALLSFYMKNTPDAFAVIDKTNVGPKYSKSDIARLTA
jgi:hypothetical protein